MMIKGTETVQMLNNNLGKRVPQVGSITGVPNLGVMGKEGQVLVFGHRCVVDNYTQPFEKRIVLIKRSPEAGAIVKINRFVGETKPHESSEGVLFAEAEPLTEKHVNEDDLFESYHVFRGAHGAVSEVFEENGRVKITLSTRTKYESRSFDQKVTGSISEPKCLTLTRVYPLHDDPLYKGTKANEHNITRIAWPEGPTLSKIRAALVTWDPNKNRPRQSVPEGQDVYVYLTEEYNSRETLEKLYSLIPG